MALGSRPQTPNVKFETGCLWPWGAGHRYYSQRFKAGAHGLGEQATGAQCESRRPAGERAIETRVKTSRSIYGLGEQATDTRGKTVRL